MIDIVHGYLTLHFVASSVTTRSAVSSLGTYRSSAKSLKREEFEKSSNAHSVDIDMRYLQVRTANDRNMGETVGSAALITMHKPPQLDHIARLEVSPELTGSYQAKPNCSSDAIDL